MAYDVALISMPWAPIWCPSIQLGIVTRVLADAGITAAPFHGNLELFQFLDGILQTSDDFDRFSNSGALARWVFAVPPYEDPARAPRRESDLIAHLYPDGVPDEARGKVERARRVRERIPAFLAKCLDEVLAHDPKIVGFSCSFRQRVPSLVLARMIKDARPDVKVVFGGTYMAGVMGEALARTHDWVDVVVRGEAEPIAARLFRELLAGSPISPHQGLIVRRGDTLEIHPEDEAVKVDLATVPIADHLDYFTRLRAGSTVVPAIPIEGSRGCWWWRMKCKFCGVRDNELRYRTRPIERVADELIAQAERHGVTRFFFVDSIVEPASFAELLERLHDRGKRFTYWVQAKPNFTRAQVGRLAQLGLTQIFVGIESLSTAILAHIRKGITALTAIRMLKWGTELGMKVTWNLLYGFPGEPVTEYETIAERMRSLTHLHPPFALMPVELDRSSVYFDRANEYGIAIGEADPWLDPILLRAAERGMPDAVRDLAGCFPMEVAGPRIAGTPALDACRAALDAWWAAGADSRLWCEGDRDRVVIRDRRANLPARDHVLDRITSRAYLLCERGIDAILLGEALDDEGIRTATGDVREILDRLVADRLVLRDGDRYLGLAIAPRWLPLGEVRRRRLPVIGSDRAAEHG